MLNAELKILGGKYQGKAIPLTTKRFLVGREQDCQLRPNSELVSRHHCVFIIDDYTVRLRDLGSTNGTRVNGDLVRGEIVLNPGDRVTIGRLDVELVVRTGAPAKAVPASAAAAAAGSAIPSATMEIPAIDAPIESAGTVSSQANETSIEIPSSSPTPADQMPTVANIGGDTAIIPGAAGAPMAPLAVNSPMMPMAYPQMGYGFPMQGYPGMPGYGFPMQMPQGYPVGMPMMPQYPMQQAPAASGKGGAATVDEPPVRLPDPTTTGAKAPVPAAAAPTGQQTGAPQATPSTSAGDIIKQFMQRRSST